MERTAGNAQGVFRALLTPPFRFLWKITTEGLGHVPDSGGAIIAPNHISVLDSFFVPLVLPRRITYVGKAEYMDDWKTRLLFPAMGMIPIDRSGGDSAQRALDAAAGILDAGELFGIYPEGTRSRDGVLHRGHTGMARLSLRTGAPIVPVGIIGTDEVQPPEARMPAPFRRVHIRFGRPVDPGRYAGRSDDRLVLRQITDEVMFEIRALSGQAYVDTYATKPSKAPAEAVPAAPGAPPVVPFPTPAATPPAPTPLEPAAAEPAAARPAPSEQVEVEPAAARVVGDGSGGAGLPEPEPVAAAAGASTAGGSPPRARAEVSRRRVRAGYAPSAAAPSTDGSVLDVDTEVGERRSSTEVLRSRPLVGV